MSLSTLNYSLIQMRMKKKEYLTQMDLIIP